KLPGLLDDKRTEAEAEDSLGVRPENQGDAQATVPERSRALADEGNRGNYSGDSWVGGILPTGPSEEHPGRAGCVAETPTALPVVAGVGGSAPTGSEDG